MKLKLWRLLALSITICLVPLWAAAQSITSFTVVNADTGADIATFVGSGAVSITATPRINIRANASNVKSVVFTDGSTAKHTENSAPYAYKGNNGPVYYPWAPSTGTYVINATPFAGSGGKGTAGTVATLTLTVTSTITPPPPTLASFTVVNADTGADIATFTSSGTVSVVGAPNINVRANGSGLQSVVFADSSATSIDSALPYAYKGDVNGVYAKWAPAAGTYVINGTPYSGSGGTGTAGLAATLTLTITNTQPQSQVLTYSPNDTTDFINPERGWMERYGQSKFPGARSGDTNNPTGYSVVWTSVGNPAWNGTSDSNPFRLDNYRQSRLPDALLDAVRSEFAAARAAGIKLKVRFAYNYSKNGTDTSKEWMRTHISQLGPVLTENADTIASMDAGFIGKWGEMHSSSHIVSTSGGDPAAAIVEVVRDLLNATPDTLSVGVRYPDIVRDIYGDPGYVLPLDQIFSGSKQSRVGWYNDCLWSNKGNAGTYDKESFEKDRDTFEKVGSYAATSGESCDLGGLNEYNTCAAVLADMAAIGGPDTLLRGFWKDMYSNWIGQGCYEEVSRRLGYRLQLLKATLPAAVSSGQPMTVKLQIHNAGFGKVYNMRPLDLVFVGPDQVLTARLTSDARPKLPLAGQTVESEWTVAAPAGLKVGQVYRLYLRLPDPSSRLEVDPRYSIQLASDSPWDPATGRHDLRATVQVR